MGNVLQYLDEFEFSVCLWLNRQIDHRSVRRFFTVISRLGDGVAWLMLGLAVVAADAGELPNVLKIGVTAGIGALLYRLLKQKLVRERPFVRHAAIACGTPPLDRYSFPSGHTLHAVSFTLMFAAIMPVSMLLSVPFAAMVAVSRVVLGLHYPTDVLAGAVLGAALAITSQWLWL